MKRTTFKRVSNVSVNPTEGTITIFGDDAKGGAEVTFSLEVALRIAAEAPRSVRIKEAAERAGPLQSSLGPWRELAMTHFSAWEVTDLPLAPKPSVAVVLDAGKVNQLSIPLYDEVARQLAADLLARTQRDTTRSPNQHN